MLYYRVGMSNIYKCEYCIFLSSRKYNVKRHCLLVHNKEYNNNSIKTQNGIKDDICGIKDDINVIEDDIYNIKDISNTILNNSTHDITNNVSNTNIYITDNISNNNTNINTSINIKCPSCYLCFKKQRYLTLHIPKCKKINNPHECGICHKLFASKDSKNRHMKQCKNTQVILFNNTKNTDSVHNINNNSNNTNDKPSIHIHNQQNIENQTNNTIIQNTINIIAYKEDDTIQFLNDHITAEDLTKIFDGRTTVDAFRKYTQLLMQRPENRLVKKTNSRSNCSQVFTEDQKWESRLDKEVYPKLACEIANNNWDRIRFVVDELKMNKKMLSHVLDDLEMLASGETAEDLNNYKKVISILKLFIVDMTHEEDI